MGGPAPSLHRESTDSLIYPFSFALTIMDSYLELLRSAAIEKDVSNGMVSLANNLLAVIPPHQIGPEVSRDYVMRKVVGPGICCEVVGGWKSLPDSCYDLPQDSIMPGIEMSLIPSNTTSVKV